MNKYLLFSIILSVLFLQSCDSKNDEIIAIDILITLPETVEDYAVKLNQEIRLTNPENFKLDEHHIPHITLLQCYVLKSDLPEIESLLVPTYEFIRDQNLRITELQYNSTNEESFSSLGIEKSTALMTLHKFVINRLEPFIQKRGSSEAYVKNPDNSPIDQFTIDYVPKFVSHHSHENYNPHISLGVAKKSLLDSLQSDFKPLKFKASTVAMYQLGAYGTAQVKLWESE